MTPSTIRLPALPRRPHRPVGSDPGGRRPLRDNLRCRQNWTVFVRYYGPGNPVAKDAGAFLDRQLRPGLVKLEGEQTSKASETLLDGRKASAFTHSTYEMWPPHSIDSKRVPVNEETIVMQHEKGFFVLRFSATTSSFGELQPVFQHVRESFHVTG